MIRKSAPPQQYGRSNGATQRKIDHLYSCLRYCEDTFECRRTLQLQFFGERFDKAKCNKTCDNCRIGNVPESRDVSNTAREILQLLESVMSQKRGRGVTLHQLSELWRGTKNKTHTKFLQTEALNGYGKGSKFNKNDVDTIVHAMVFEKILEETSEESGSGFQADYVHPGSKAPQLQSGTFQFHVRFAVSKATAPKEKKSKKQNDGDKKPKAKKKKSKSNEAPPNDIEPSSADKMPGNKRTAEKTALPTEHNKVLIDRIKKLVNIMAEEVSL